MIERFLEKIIKKKLPDAKAIIITGPRQIGKSTLLQPFKTKCKQPVAWWNGDETDYRSMLENATSTKLSSLITVKNICPVFFGERLHSRR